MDLQKINGQKSIFEMIRKSNDNQQEYWLARDIAKILGYSEFRHFLPVIGRAKEACINSKQNIQDHFEDILEMVSIGSGAKQKIKEVRLSRYACYLIVQNSDPTKPIVALGQTYFAIQTRKQELIEEIKGKVKANLTQFEAGKKVRQTIKELGGTMPEQLPVRESIKKIKEKSLLKVLKQKKFNIDVVGFEVHGIKKGKISLENKND